MRTYCLVALPRRQAPTGYINDRVALGLEGGHGNLDTSTADLI